MNLDLGRLCALARPGRQRPDRLLLPLAGLAVVVTLAASSGARAAGNVCPSSNPPNEIIVAGGSGQTAQLGKPFQTPLQVKLANSNGCPLTGNLAGVNITFDAPGSGASGIFAGSGGHIATVGTDSQGVATAPTFTANYTTGNYAVDAESDYGSVELFLSNTAAGLPAAIAASAGSGQEAAINSQYPQPLQARVTDASGNPVQGATVNFSIVTGATGAGASFLGGGQASATTDANGLASSPPLIANGTPGKFLATASVEGLASVASYTLDNHAAVTTIAHVGAPSLSATVETRYTQPLWARVLDASGQPVEGISVTFSITTASSGAGAAFINGTTQATELTDANGQATAPPLVANKTAGTFTATATIAGTQPVSYTLRNLAGAADSVTAGAASGEATTIGKRFPVALAVAVTDENGNPVQGATVVFTAPVRGASGRFLIPSRAGSPARGAYTKASARSNRGRARKPPGPRLSRTVRVKTDSNGIAIAPTFRANKTTGGYVVTAAVQGTRKTVAFALLNEPRNANG